MLCSHKFGPYHVRKEIAETPQFLLRNRRGGFFLWSNEPTSKYQGLWTRIGGTLYKSIAQIKPGVDLPVKKVTNYFWGFSVDRGNDFHELSYMDPESDSLIYEMKNQTQFSLILDGAKQFDPDEWGRVYAVEEKDKCLLISYEKKIGDATAYRFTLAVAGWTRYEIHNEWVRHRYFWDVSRQDPPFERPVFNALGLTGKRVVFSVCTEKEDALAKAQSVLARADLIKESLERETEAFARKNVRQARAGEVMLAHLAARFSTEGMVVRDNSGKPQGMYAGIPWFTQFWLRDFAIAARQMHPADRKSLVMDFFGELEKNNAVHACEEGKCALGADSELLLFSCAADMHGEKEFTEEEKERVSRVMERYLNEVLPVKMNEGLVVNSPKETWMDTQYRDDGRAGARIEMQALALKALQFAHQLTGNSLYRRREQELARTVRLCFWEGDLLRDGATDNTIRPNVFLAYHFYPDLLLSHEWEGIFTHALEVLWLPWGGIATVSKTHPLFCGRDRFGQDPDQSYHHGDAWFFINNIAALSLARVNRKKFKPFINKLLSASTRDVLWHGIAGSHSEVSSADAYEPRGCLAQTWSAATYADTLEKISGDRVQ